MKQRLILLLDLQKDNDKKIAAQDAIIARTIAQASATLKDIDEKIAKEN